MAKWSRRKMAKLKALYVCQLFSASNYFIHIFNMSVTYLQNAEKIHRKLYEELISQNMHYQTLFTRCSCQKMAKLKTVNLSKIFFQHQTSSCTSSVCL